MKLPSVYPLTIPSSQRMIRMIAMVSSMGHLLVRAVTLNHTPETVSNGCATGRPPEGAIIRAFAVVFAVSVVAIVGAPYAQAQPVPRLDDPTLPAEAGHPPRSGSQAATVAQFLSGAAIALGAHEGGHLLFDVAFDARPGIGRVDFHGIPFFAVTHRGGLSPRREFTISSAGFWVQHATDEWLLTRRPHIRRERAPLAKGVFAFNILSSLAYSGAAFARTGPIERDTRGMADSLGVNERWIGLLVLVPAAFDLWRYLDPGARTPVWLSRGVKAGAVVLVLK